MNRWSVFLPVCALLQIAVVRLTPTSHLSWAYNSPFMQALWGFFCLGILHGWLGSNGPLSTAISRPLAWIGRASYSLYATHSPAIFLGTWLLLALDLHAYPLQLAVALSAAAMFTFAGYRLLEQPYAKARRAGAL